MNPIAVVHWLEADNIEKSAPFYSDTAVKSFTAILREEGVCYWTCLCGAAVPHKASTRLIRRVS